MSGPTGSSQEPGAPPGLAGLARAYLVPIVLVGVALVQLGFVESRGLTRWKGGGFGMYSDPHPILREVWLEIERPSGVFRYRTQRGSAERLAANECKYWASEACLAELGRHSGRTRLRAVEVWEPGVSTDSFAFERRRLATYERR